MTGKKINIKVTEPKDIREEMRSFYQDIFAKQQILEGPSAIENFLNSDGDYRPLLELKKGDSVIYRETLWKVKFRCMN